MANCCNFHEQNETKLNEGVFQETRLNTKKCRKLVDVLRGNLIPHYALRNIICWDIFNRDFLEINCNSGFPLSLPKWLIIEINPSKKNMEQSTYNYITSKNVSYLLNNYG